MKHYVILMLTMLAVRTCHAQKVGYEARTNGRSYLTMSLNFKDTFKPLENSPFNVEWRHRVDLMENRVTLRHKLPIGNKFVLSTPLHHKIEKAEPTLEPRFIWKAGKNVNLWVQSERSYKEQKNTAFATDIAVDKFLLRAGWDTSNTWRFRISYKF